MLRSSMWPLLAFCLAPCSVVWVGCEQHDADPGTNGVHYTVVIPMRDLETNWRGRITVETSRTPWFSWDEFVEGELDSWDGNLRVVRWPSGDVVAGSWAFSVDASTNRGVFAFEPEESLSPDDGWHALQIRFGQLGVPRGYFGPDLFDERYPGGIGHQFHDGWSTTRFYGDAYPLLGIWGGFDRGGDGWAAGAGVRVWQTEPLRATASVDLQASVRATVNGASVRCRVEPATLAEGDLMTGLTVECDPPAAEGEYAVELDRLPLASADGLRVHYCGRGAQPRWEARVGDIITSDCDDTALLDIPPSREAR